MTIVELGVTPTRNFGAHTLSVARIEPISETVWPGRVATAIVLQGCPWQCTYCNEPALQDARVDGRVAWRDVMARLRRRRTVIDAVVFTGGEPTRQLGLLAAIREIKALGLSVGLLTSGAYPARLSTVVNEVDWIGFDIKATPQRYDAITGQGVSGARAWTSLEIVENSGTEYEVRITVDPTVHTREDVLATARDVIRHGRRAPVLQQVRPEGTSPEYRARLAGRGLYDVMGWDDLPDLERR